MVFISQKMSENMNHKVRESVINKEIKFFMKKFFIFSCGVLFVLHAEAITLAPGESWSVQLSGSINQQVLKTGDWKAYNNYGEAFVINVSNSDKCLLNSQLATNSEGYTGYLIGDDIVLQLEGMAEGTARFDNYPGMTTATGTWSSDGNFSVTPANNLSTTVWCGGAGVAGASITVESTDKKNASANLTAHIRVGPLAKQGSYTIPGLYLTAAKGAGKYSAANELLMSSQPLTVEERLECNIIPPSFIDFGTVESRDSRQGQLLAVAHQNITVTCSGVSGQVTSKTETSFQGLGDWGTNWGQLNLMNSGGRSPGYVRGRYLENADGTCSGDSTNEVAFDGRGPTATSRLVRIAFRSPGHSVAGGIRS